eukprot:2137833-Amphidinium_carterae.1
MGKLESRLLFIHIIAQGEKNIANSTGNKAYGKTRMSPPSCGDILCCSPQQRKLTIQGANASTMETSAMDGQHQAA